MSADPAAWHIRGSRLPEMLRTQSGLLYSGMRREDICLLPGPAVTTALSEGFCPQCLDPLGGDPRNFCARCQTRWRFQGAATAARPAAS